MQRWGFLLLGLTLTGCATLSPSPASVDKAPPRPAAAPAEESVLDLQKQAARAEAEIKMLRRQLAAVQVEVERLAAEAERSLAPPPVRPVPSPSFESSELEPIRAVPPAVVQVTPEELETAAPVAPVPPPAPAVGVPLAGQTIYDRGYTLYHQGRYIDAESSFQRFLQAHADTELADNAQFWIGESRFAREDFMGALLAFQEVLDRYPGGNKVADSLLKVGDCLLRLDNTEGGMERYREVVRRFPGSAAAAMAEERLSRGPE